MIVSMIECYTLPITVKKKCIVKGSASNLSDGEKACV